MVDIQNAALSKIILDGDILPFIDAKIDENFFPDPEHLAVFEMVLEHYRKYSAAPSPEVIAKAYPTYKLSDYPEPTDYYLNQLQQDRKRVILTGAVQEYVERIDTDKHAPGAALGDDLEHILRKGLADAAHEISHGRDTDFFLSADRVVERIRERAADPDAIRGITTGFPTLDEITGGLQDQHLVTFVGLPKAGKSSIVLKIAKTAHEEGARVLFFTFEMSTEEQEDRLLSLLTGIDLTQIDRGRLNKFELDRIEKAMRLRATLDGLTITSDISSATTLTGMQAKVIKYRPDLLIVDGVYLMEDETGHDQGSPQALTALTRGFKRMAQNRDIPILITTQALAWKSKGGLTVNSIGYSSSFIQDSDKILGTESPPEDDSLSVVKTMAQRTGRAGNVYIEKDWGRGHIEEIPELVYQQRLAQAMPPMMDGKKGKPGSDLRNAWDDE